MPSRQIITNVIKKALEILQNELRKQKEKQTDKMFQDLKTSKLLRVRDNHLTLRNCLLKRNSALKKYVLKSAKILDANVPSHCYYPKNIH